MNINDFKEYHDRIEIVIIPYEKKYDKFINILNKEDESYYHIYFNESKEEIQRYNLNAIDKVWKIKIIIDNKVKSLSKLFKSC